MTASASSEWKRVAIGEVATVNPPKPKYREANDGDLVGFVPMAAVDEVSGAIAQIEERPLGELRTKSYRTFASNDVLFAKITPCMENGKAAVVPGLPNGYGFGSTEFHVISPSDRLDARFVWRFVRQRSFRADAEAHMIGSVGQLRVPADFLRETEIPLPSVEEQRRIADILDQVDAHREAADLHLSRAQTMLSDSRRAVLAFACSGRLSGDWRSIHPEVGPVDLSVIKAPARGRRRKSVEELDIELPELPESYQVVSLSSIASAIEYGTSRKAEGNATDVPVLRMGNIQDGLLDLRDLKYITSDNEVKRLLLGDGDLLFNRTNSPELVGKSAVWRGDGNATFASYLIRVRLRQDLAVPEFVNYWINSAWGRLWARQVKTDGVSQSNINGTKLGAMPVPLPPLEEQIEIVRRVEDLLKGSATILGKAIRVGHLLNRASEAVAAKAFRGELLEALE